MSRMLMWCSLLLLMMIKVITVCAVHANFCAGVYKHGFLKIHVHVCLCYQIHACDLLANSSLNQAVPYVHGNVL